MRNIERLLRLAADYQNFCSDAHEANLENTDSGELSADELDFIAAAAGTPAEWKKEPENC